MVTSSPHINHQRNKSSCESNRSKNHPESELGAYSTNSEENGGEGFFSENYRTLMKAQKQIEDVVEMLNKDQIKMGKALRKQKDTFRKFLKELQQQ